MSLPSYPEYKPSGVEWLGEVPGHWGVKRLKLLCDVQTGDKDTVNAVDDGEYPFFVRSQTVEKINSFTFDCEAVLTAGDGVGVGKVFHYINGKFDFHQRVYMMNRFRCITGKFFFRYLAATFHKVALDGGAKSTVDSLRMPLFMNFEITVPPSKEQDEIIAFLDRETGKIEALIAEQRRLVELLAEKRQAVISHAVTKGLNPKVPMKNSGIEWLGDVPKHWVIGALKHFVKSTPGAIKTGPFGSHLTSAEMQTGVIKVFNQRNVIDNDFEGGDNYISEDKFNSLASFEAFPGDLLVTTRGTVGRGAILPDNVDRGILHPCLLRVQPEQKMLATEYLLALVQDSDLLKTQIGLMSNATTIEVIYSETMANLILPLPPILEQKEILTFLDNETAKFDELTLEANRAIELLQERRSALISAAVTGKIDIRKI